MTEEKLNSLLNGLDQVICDLTNDRDNWRNMYYSQKEITDTLLMILESDKLKSK